MIAVVDYGMGNVGSIVNILKRIGVESTLSGDPRVLLDADRIILPGVGAFDAGMARLSERGLVAVLNEIVVERRRPVLGLCLGMQLLGRESAEGSARGLGWIDARAVRFDTAADRALRVPHMGWNSITPVRDHPLLGGLVTPKFYFVHSYHLVCNDPADVLATTQYSAPFPSMVAHGNILGAQFHPEKSHRYGMQLFRNFAAIESDA